VLSQGIAPSYPPPLSQPYAFPWILKIAANKVVFLVLNGKEQISPLLAPFQNFIKNPLVVQPFEKS